MTKRSFLWPILAGLLLAGVGCTAEMPEGEPDYTVAYYDGASGETGRADVMVVTEGQWTALGEGIRALFQQADMLYVPGQAGADVLCAAAGLTAAPDSRIPEDSHRLGTALTAEGGGVHVNEVFAVWEAEGNTPQPETSMDADGIHAAVLVERSRRDGEGAAGKSGSAVVYDGEGARAGVMGYTLYIQPFQSGDGQQAYDCHCWSVFLPEGTGRCEEMRVTLDSPLGQVVDVEEPAVQSLAEQTGAEEDPEVQVSRQFDMTANERTWIFQPEQPQQGEGWGQMTGVRICADSGDGPCDLSVHLELAQGSGLVLNGDQLLAAGQ